MALSGVHGKSLAWLWLLERSMHLSKTVVKETPERS